MSHPLQKSRVDLRTDCGFSLVIFGVWQFRLSRSWPPTETQTSVAMTSISGYCDGCSRTSRRKQAWISRVLPGREDDLRHFLKKGFTNCSNGDGVESSALNSQSSSLKSGRGGRGGEGGAANRNENSPRHSVTPESWRGPATKQTLLDILQQRCERLGGETHGPPQNIDKLLGNVLHDQTSGPRIPGLPAASHLRR